MRCFGPGPPSPEISGGGCRFLPATVVFARLGILCRTIQCRSPGTGGPHHRVRGFSRTQDHPDIPTPTGRITIASPPPPGWWGSEPQWFAWGPGRAANGPVKCQTARLTTAVRPPPVNRNAYQHGPQLHRTDQAPEGTRRDTTAGSMRQHFPPHVSTVGARPVGISTVVIITPVSLARSDSPRGGDRHPWSPWSLGMGDSHPSHRSCLHPPPTQITPRLPPGFTHAGRSPYHPHPHQPAAEPPQQAGGGSRADLGGAGPR